MRKLKKILLYLLYAVMAGIVFLYLLFPANLAKDYIQFQSHRLVPDFMIKIGTLSLHFPWNVKLKEAELYYPNTSLFFDQLKIKPAFGPLCKGKWDFLIQAHLYQGTLQGNARQSPDQSKWLFNADLRDIQMDQIPFIKMSPYLKMIGALEGRVESVLDANQNLNAHAQLLISECSFKSNLPVLDKLDFRFDKIELVFLVDRSTLKLQEARAFGKQFNAIAVGTIALRQPIEKSILDLDLTIQPQTGAFKNLDDAFTKELMTLIKNDFSIKVFGTLDAPDYYLNSAIYLN
ncbi:MAG: type II secretion system protein GspN [Desulfobacteraceae bacterium]|nr:MAG: type II secretion system protein GspN [Desulfobacteraceae bacterium]